MLQIKIREKVDGKCDECGNKKFTEWDYESKKCPHSYSLSLNQRMDSINSQWGPNVVVPFTWIGTGLYKKLIGIVKEGKGYSIY